jgi:hypothetical protein
MEQGMMSWRVATTKIDVDKYGTGVFQSTQKEDSLTSLYRHIFVNYSKSIKLDNERLRYYDARHIQVCNCLGS